MRGVWRALVVGCVLVPVFAQAEDIARLELNKAENIDNRCSLTFLLENKTNRTIDSLKPDLALFNPEGVIQRRMVIELGPVRGMRTNVRTYATDGQCSQMRADRGGGVHGWAGAELAGRDHQALQVMHRRL